MKDNVSEFFGGLEGMAKAKKMALIAANFAKLGYGASAADNFGDSFLGFKIELNAFFKNLEELKKQGAEKGKKIETDFGVIEYPEKSGKFRLNCKKD